MSVLLKNILLDAAKVPPDWENLCGAIAAGQLHIPAAQVTACEILSASLDSRRSTPKILLTLKAEVNNPSIRQSPDEEFASFIPVPPDIPETTRLDSPLIVGTGPAGIYAAWVLAKAGCRPVIIDRGAPVEERSRDCAAFLEQRTLDENSNLLIGEGGAGTYSDGKLYTGTKDRRAGWVKQLMVKCGAPPEILYQSRPHAGSDKLRIVAANLRKEIEAMGGVFRFHTHITDIAVKNGTFHGLVTASGELLEAPAALLAPGLGGRELCRQLMHRLDWEAKPFQTGCRIEHPQTLIDRHQYHMNRPAALGAAEYHVVARNYPRHVASFCMCPGGSVVNATAWQNRTISNGMSMYARDGEFANSCLITTFGPGELGNPDQVYALMEQIESQTFLAGGGDYTMPAQDAAAFIRQERQLKLRRSAADTGIIAARIDALLPDAEFRALSAALRELDRKIPGFIREGKFVGTESCVSAPVRFCRDRETLQSSVANCFLAGEGTGHAGGIISAACDGIRAAEKMAAAFAC